MQTKPQSLEMNSQKPREDCNKRYEEKRRKTKQADGVHHVHLRKRQGKLEPYPHPQRLKRVVDRSVYVVGVVGPVMTLPQLYAIWVEQNASGVSAASWSAYFFIAIFWLLYGILHREKPLIVMYASWILIDALVVVGTLMHG